MAKKRKELIENDGDRTARSTAAIFRNIKTSDSILQEEGKKTDKDEKVDMPNEPLGNSQDDINDAGFPFNYIYKFQDYLNQHMNLLKSAQLLVFGFFIQLIYLRQDKFDHAKKSLPMMLFSCAGVLSCTVLSIVKSKEETIHVPDFNYFYSILIPSLFNIVHYDPSWMLINNSLNYFIVDKMHPIFNLISSVIFFVIYKEESGDTITVFEFLQISAAHFLFSYALHSVNTAQALGGQKDKVNDNSNKLVFEKSLRNSEIQLICLLIVNIIFNPAITKDSIPLQIFQKLLISLIITSFLAYPIHSYLNGLINIGVFGAIFCGLTIFQLQTILGNNALIWLYEYVSDDPEKVQILKIWVSSALIIIPLIFYLADKFSLNTRRKIWHLVIIVALTFSNNILFNQVEFTILSLLGMIIVFLILEIIRYNEISFIGSFLKNSLNKFQDLKDSGPFNLSYIYLLSGVILPIVYDYLMNKNKVTIIRYLGLIALGVGDSFASIIGRRFGSLKWKGSNKSVQGTIAFIITTFISINIVEYYNIKNKDYEPITNWENALVSILLGGVLEGTSNINDNYLIPTFIPIAYELLSRCY
ncbi:SEC59 [Candida pseudojiufengensis]|uniref:SEC59 n=1 Tax=Candida pseudojiufengensis TaxID=497109 RepID=UPI0022250CEE|nr:SEC59 [Candida pseudojiufengensis]KAI5959599.1 SEC59 [Candida pseudojiufengensis]